MGEVGKEIHPQVVLVTFKSPHMCIRCSLVFPAAPFLPHLPSSPWSSFRSPFCWRSVPEHSSPSS